MVRTTMRRAARWFAAGLLVAGASPAIADQAQHFDPAPWLADLAQMREAFDTKYANREWLERERDYDLAAAFERLRGALAIARSEAEATAAFNRFVQRIGDGHVSIAFPRPTFGPAPSPTGTSPAAATVHSYCQARGYGPPPGHAGVAARLPGYSAIDDSDLLPSGTVTVGGETVGILRIPVFDPHGSAALCAAAVEALALPLDRACAEDCESALITEAYRRLGLAMQDRLERLRAAGARSLVVDIAGNGGGSEWTEAAARMVSAKPLQSARIGFVRGAHWERLWDEQAARLRGFAAAANRGDRARLMAWAEDAEEARYQARRRCPPTRDPSCPWLGEGGYATGQVGRAPSGAFDGKDWGVHVFNPAQHTYKDGVWQGPVIVVTDQETWSAAEQFAAVLQDNRAAWVLGSRTGGAGCGYTWGGTPTRLANSGAVLKLRDCVRFRADGSNEVRGVIPDQLLAWRPTDGLALRASMLAAALPEALARARSLSPR